MTYPKLAVVAALSAALMGCDASVEVSSTSDDRDPAYSQPAPGPDLEVHIPYEKFTLSNGLRVVVHEDRKAPIVAVSVWYHVGSKDEPEGKTGFAHLFEHLMFNGTENYDGEFFVPLEAAGGTDLNGTTWFDRTNYFETVPTPALDLALWLESDRMGHLLGVVTEEKLTNQRGVVQNEKRQGDNQPYGLVEYAQLEALFPPGHPYRHSTIGSLEDLDNASLEDVKSWFNKYYGAANTVVVLAGDIDAETARPLMETYFGDIAAGPDLQRAKANAPSLSANKIEEMTDSRAPNTRIYRNWVVPGRTTEDAHLLRLAMGVLGSGKNSRLFKELVYDNALASSVDASVQRFELASMVEISVDLLDGVDPDEVTRRLDAVMADFLDNGPTIEEVSRIKTGIIASRVRGLEKVGGFGGKAVALAQGELYANNPDFYAQEIAWIDAASAQDVLDVSREWLARPYYQLTVKKAPTYATGAGGADRSKLPDVSGFPDLSFPPIETATLPNGLKLVLAQRDSVPVIEMALQFDAGYAADHGGKFGTANLALSMLDEGTTSRSALDIAAEMDRLGGELTTRSNLDRSAIRLSALAPNLRPSLDVMADVVLNPAFDAEEFERLRTRWLAFIDREQAQPVQLGLRELAPLLYGSDHAYGMPLTGSGTKSSVAAITRDDLVAFKDTWLRPDNATLYVVGNLTMTDLSAMIEDAFGGWSAPDAPLPVKQLDTVKNAASPRVVILDKPGSPQTVILGGSLLPPSGAEDALALDTANDILGGEFTSRVNMNLREDKGWAYGAFTITFDGAGQRLWLAYAPVQTDKTGASLNEMISEVSGYLNGRPATEGELTRIKNTRVNSLPGNFETNTAILADLMTSGRIGRDLGHVNDLKAKFAALDLNAVQAAADRYIDPNAVVWLLVGDRAQIEDQVRALGIAEIETLTISE